MGDVIEILTTATNTVEVEAQGPQGIPGVGVPTGGSALQILRKKTSTDYDTEWAAAGSGSGSVTSVALASTDLTISGSPITDSGTITANIAANAVTLEKLQTISSEHLLGRHGSGNGGVQQIGLGTGLAISGSNVGVTFGSSAGTACQGNDARLSDARTPSSTLPHAASHASAGSDPLAPSDIGAQSLFTAVNVTSGVQTSPHQLSALRAQAVRVATTINFTIRLPETGHQSGDIVEIRAATLSSGAIITIERGAGPSSWTTIATISSQGGKLRFVADGTGRSNWEEDTYFTTNGTIGAPDSHTHGNLTNDGKLGSTAGLPVVTTTAGAVTTLALGSANQVLKVNSGGTAVEFGAAGGVTSGSVDNAVLRADGTGGSTSQSSDLVIDDATTSTQANVALRNNHSETNSALVLCNKGTGAFIVSPARPDGTSSGGNARGTNAIDIQTTRNSATQVAANDAVAVGSFCTSTVNAVTVGRVCTASSNSAIAIGNTQNATGEGAVAVGNNSTASGARSVALGRLRTASLRGQFETLPFSSIYWEGSTTSATPLILNLEGTATNRFTIAANTALIADIFLIARSSDNTKFLSARRSVAIYRDNANVTALIGDVQTLGNDQSFGSPTWSIAITADNTNEALQLEVTGATGETVNWRATAFYRVV